MTPERIARAHADTAGLAATGVDWALVAGVPCIHLGLPQPWATRGQLLALDAVPEPDVVAQVAGWLASRSPQWTLMLRARHAAPLTGFAEWDRLPVLYLPGEVADPPASTADVRIEPATDAAQYLVAYGSGLAPLVTAAHLAAPHLRHFVARRDGEVAGCARVELLGGTAHVSAISVSPRHQRQGIGALLTAHASRIGRELSDLVWLHCTDTSRALYERLGFRLADDHVQLRPR